MKYTKLSAFLTGIAIAASTVAGTLPPHELAVRMDAAINSAIAQNRIVGAVVLVAKDGKVIYHRAAGLADREAKKPMTEDTIFRLTSVSKPVATTAFLRLVEEGRLGLDDPVTKWLPDFKPSFEGKTPVITIRQLLTHTSGIGYSAQEGNEGPYHTARISDGAVDVQGSEPTLEQEVARIANVPLRFVPGAKWNYGLSIDVMGAVASAVTKKPLPEVISELVTRPLGMKDTGFVVTDTGRLAANYYAGDKGPERMKGHTELPLGPMVVGLNPDRNTDVSVWPSAGAGLAGTAGDLLTLLEAIRTGAGGVLSKNASSGMMAVQVGVDAQANGPGWGFGYGGAVLVDPAQTKTPQSAGTYSWSGAYGHTWFVDPAEGLTVIAFTNTAFEGMIGKFAIDVRNAAYR